MANKRSTRKRNGKKRAVKVKMENQPAQPETPEFSDDSGTSEDSFFPTPQSPAKEADWCPDPKLRKVINKFFAALQSATGKVCRFMPSDLSPGEDPLRREYQNLAEIKNSAEKIICEYINTNNEGMDALDAKLKHQANLVKSASRASENHQQLRISNSRFDLMDVDANTSSDREEADPESKYNDLAGNSLLAKQVLKESSMIEAEMQSLNRRIASKERQLQAMSEELRKMRETLNVQAGQKEVINDDNAIQSDGSYKGNNELERGVDAMDNETYLSQLLQDQCSLRNIAPGKFKYLQQILDKEIASVSLKVNQEKIDVENVEKTKKNKITSLTEIIMVPVDEYPTYNFVGRILGPRGMTVRQLEEQTGCKIMVRGRGSIKGKIRDRGSEDEPLHVQIQCEDYPDRVKEKMKRAVDRVNELLTPPPDGKDELKRKQLVELAIINGTYRPTNATKNALQTPSPFDAGHLTSRLDYPMMSPPRTNQLPDGDLLQKLQLLQLLSCNNPSITDYLLRCSMPGSPMFSNPLLSPAQSPSNNFSNIGGVHQASFQEYLDAAALVNSVPTFTHDGSGDCPKK